MEHGFGGEVGGDAGAGVGGHPCHAGGVAEEGEEGLGEGGGVVGGDEEAGFLLHLSCWFSDPVVLLADSVVSLSDPIVLLTRFGAGMGFARLTGGVLASGAVVVSRTASGLPPTRVAMTGRPAAIASMMALEKPSEREGRTKRVARARKACWAATPSMLPRKRTLGCGVGVSVLPGSWALGWGVGLASEESDEVKGRVAAVRP